MKRSWGRRLQIPARLAFVILSGASCSAPPGGSDAAVVDLAANPTTCQGRPECAACPGFCEPDTFHDLGPPDSGTPQCLCLI